MLPLHHYACGTRTWVWVEHIGDRNSSLTFLLAIQPRQSLPKPHLDLSSRVLINLLAQPIGEVCAFFSLVEHF